jgi:hypothetical protein
MVETADAANRRLQVLGTFEEALVALATDPARRARLRNEGEASFEGLALDATERRALAAIPVEALERYARSLVAKKWHEVSRTTPLTSRVVPDLARIYRSWAEGHPAVAEDIVLSPGSAEALRALSALRLKLSASRYPDYAADLLAFEVLSACSRADKVERFLTSRWQLSDIAADIAKSLLPADPPEQPTLFRFDGTGVRWRPRA